MINKKDERLGLTKVGKYGAMLRSNDELQS